MRCLHLCNDFLGSKVHINLYKKLDELGVEQTVFVPFRTKYKDLETVNYFKNKKSKVVLSKPLRLYHRILFFKKIRDLLYGLEDQVDPKNYDILFASTLYSDGFLAYKLYQKYSVPYIVAVRSTDVDVFMRFRPDLHFVLLKILTHAKKIIFISDSLKDKFTKRIGENKSYFVDKSQIIYNGLDPYWLTGTSPFKKKPLPFNVLYVGSLIKRKNIIRVINSVLELNKRGVGMVLNIVGDKGEYKNQVVKIAAKYKGIINYHGSIKDKDELKKQYQDNHIFIMPSYRETFGLVYLEAISQGLPIIVGKSEAVDGIFKDVSIAVSPYSTQSIEQGLIAMFDRYPSLNFSNIDLSKFDWQNISNQYFELISSVVNKN